MTIEAHIAVREALKFECKQDAIRKNQDGTVKLTLTIASTDFPMQLMGDPLGQRYVAVLVAINDDETPKVRAAGLPNGDDAPQGRGASSPSPAASSKRWEEMPYSQRAGILCAETGFHDWLGVRLDAQGLHLTNEEAAAAWIRGQCRIDSRAELNSNVEAQRLFDQIHASFDTWRKYGDR